MKKLLILALALLLICTTALAETKTFTIYVYSAETLNENIIAFPTEGASAVKKNDGDQRFYLTPTSTNLLSGRKVYFRSMYSRSTSSSAIASNYITVTKNSCDSPAYYKTGKAVGGHTYYLAGACQAIQDDPFLGYGYQVEGRWTP